MKLQPTGILILVLLALPAGMSAQHRYWLELRGGYDAFLDDQYFFNWNNGWNAGAGLSYQAMPGMQLAGDLAYHHYPYNHKGIAIAHPCVVGWDYREEGEASYAVEASAALRLHESGKRAGLFFTVRAGLWYLHKGRVSMISWEAINPEDLTNDAYYGTDKDEFKPFGAVGLGFRVPVADRFNIMLETGFTSAYDGKPWFFPFLATVQYGL